MPDPIALTTIQLRFESRYVIKTGRIQGRVPYPYLLRDDDFVIGLPPEITIEEITKLYIEEAEKKQEASLKKERVFHDCPDCSTSFYTALNITLYFILSYYIIDVISSQLTCFIINNK